MAVTDTPVSATDCVVKIDNATGVLTDISGSSNKVEIGGENKIAEFRSFGSKWTRRRVTGKDASISLDGVYSKTASEMLDVLRDWWLNDSDVPRTIEISMPDDLTGSDRYTAEVVLADLNISGDASADEFIPVTASFMPDLELTHTVIS